MGHDFGAAQFSNTHAKPRVGPGQNIKLRLVEPSWVIWALLAAYSLLATM